MELQVRHAGQNGRRRPETPCGAADAVRPQQVAELRGPAPYLPYVVKIQPFVAAGGAGEKLVSLVDVALARHLPRARQASEDTTELAELIASDRSIRRVDERAERAAMSATAATPLRLVTTG